MEKKKIYYSDLYKWCTRIINNKEKYADTPIGQLLKDISDSPFDVSYGEPANTNVYASSLHNELVALYKILVGEGEMKKEEYLNEKYDLRPRINISTLSDEELMEAIYILSWVDFVSDLYVIQDKTIKPHSHISSHLYKIDVERSDAFLSYLIHRMYLESEGITEGSMKINQYQELSAKLDKNYEECRRILLKTKPDYNVCAFYKEQLIDGNKWKSLKEIEKRCPQFSCVKKYYDTWLYVDLCCHYIMQCINNSIGNSLINFEKFICYVNKKVKKLIKAEESYLEKKKNDKVDTFLKASEYLFRQISFYKFRDRLWGNIKAIKMIETLCEKLEGPSEEYCLLEPAVDANPYTMKEIKKLFTEDKDVDRVTFSAHFKKAKNSILQYNQVSGRNIPYSAISAKAIYREMYLDTKTYGKRQCKTMYNTLLETGMLDKSEYYFINEKINRGLYREYDCIEEYYRKNLFQEDLYYLVGLILVNVEPDVISKKMIKIVKSIERTVDTYLKKQFFPIAEADDEFE